MTAQQRGLRRFPIAVPPQTRLYRLDRDDGGWRLWIHHNAEFTAGTYLWLADDGTCTRVIMDTDGTETHFEVVP